MGKGFAILRAIVFVIVLSVTLAFVPIAYGDMKTAILVGASTFVLTLIIAWILMQIFKRG